MDEGSLILDYASPPGTSLTETDRVLRQVEREIAATPEILAWSRRTGDQLGFFITEPNFGDYVLRLREKRTRSADEVADDLRRRIEASQPALRIEFGQLVEDVIGDLTSNPQPIEVRVFGEDRTLAEAKAAQAAAILGQVRGVVDVKSGVVASGPDISLVPGPEAARLGLEVDELAAAVKPAVSGLDAGQIVRGTHTWPVRVLLAGLGSGAPAEALSEVRVPVGSGPWVRLGELATIGIEPGETEIVRQDQRTMVSVTARLTGRDLGSAMTEVQKRLRRELPLPPGMSIRYGGLWAEQQSSFRGLAAVLLGATAAVVLILVAAFRSWRQTGAVMLVVVTSLSGVFFGLHLGGATFNISSFVGAIMMVGVVAENAYFLVASHRGFLREGHSPEGAAIAAASRRARPVLMTTAAGVRRCRPWRWESARAARSLDRWRSRRWEGS
jgi:multidrug efflux pump subunit AcrB